MFSWCKATKKTFRQIQNIAFSVAGKLTCTESNNKEKNTTNLQTYYLVC